MPFEALNSHGDHAGLESISFFVFSHVLARIRTMLKALVRRNFSIVVPKKRLKHYDPSYLQAFESPSNNEGHCLVRCDARKYDWTAIAASLKLPESPWQLVLEKEEFLLAKKKESNSEDSELFVFPYGVAVMWSTTRMAENVELPLARLGAHDVVSDIWEFRSGAKDSILVDEIIFDRNVNVLAAKLAASSGLAQELKLSVFEEQVERAIDLIELVPQQMAAKGQLSISRKEINRKYGELMMIRTQINLHSDILDLPEFFFEMPEGQETYTTVTKYLQTTRRARVLNERLDLLSSLYMMISDDRSTNVGHRLEWLIIGLISVEIVIALVHHAD